MERGKGGKRKEEEEERMMVQPGFSCITDISTIPRRIQAGINFLYIPLSPSLRREGRTEINFNSG